MSAHSFFMRQMVEAHSVRPFRIRGWAHAVRPYRIAMIFVRVHRTLFSGELYLMGSPHPSQLPLHPPDVLWPVDAEVRLVRL